MRDLSAARERGREGSGREGRGGRGVTDSRCAGHSQCKSIIDFAGSLQPLFGKRSGYLRLEGSVLNFNRQHRRGQMSKAQC